MKAAQQSLILAAEPAPLVASSGRLRVALVGCGKAKAPTARRARLLYTGSLFRAAARYAEQRCDAWVILSAKRGLLGPDDVTEPYELRLSELAPPEQAAWAALVVRELRARYAGVAVEYIGLAGSEYMGVLVGEMRRQGLPIPQQPLLGFGIHDRMRWFADQMHRPAQQTEQLQLLEGGQ